MNFKTILSYNLQPNIILIREIGTKGKRESLCNFRKWKWVKTGSTN